MGGGNKNKLRQRHTSTRSSNKMLKTTGSSCGIQSNNTNQSNDNQGNVGNNHNDELSTGSVATRKSTRSKKSTILWVLGCVCLIGIVVLLVTTVGLTQQQWWQHPNNNSSPSSSSDERNIERSSNNNNTTNTTKENTNAKNVTSSSSSSIPDDMNTPTDPYATTTVFGSYELLEHVPHDSKSFTQGLVTVENKDGKRQFYESAGQYGASDLRLVDIQSGMIVQSYPIPTKYFAEGIAHYSIQNTIPNNIHSDSNITNKDTTATPSVTTDFGIIQLTWLEQTAFEYTFLDNASEPTAIHNWTFTTSNTQGWGITHDPVANVFYVSDGSIYLHVWDGTTRQEITKHAVTYKRSEDNEPQTLNYLNELEWDPVTGTVLANVFFQDIVVRIDPNNGFVTTVYNLATLYPTEIRDPKADVMNGIALTYDLLRGANATDGTDQVWVTGKYWPNVYRIRFTEPNRN